MPFTGFDPPTHGGPIETSYIDPSYNYALGPGGRFPGDTYFYLEQLAAQDPELARLLDGIGPGSANPGYEMRGGLDNRRSLTGILARLHEWNVRNTSGIADVTNPYTGTEQFYSGPGAPYGPIRGLVDQGTGNFFDGPEMRPPGVSTPTAPAGKGKGGGRRPYSGPMGPTTPTTQPYQASFLDWQPENAGTPRFVPGTAPNIPPPPPKPQRPRKPKPAPAGPLAGGQPPGGGGGGLGTGSPAPGSPAGSGGSLPPVTPEQLAELIQALESGQRPPTAGIAANSRPGFGREGFTGYDINRIFSQGPGGWQRDPTSGVFDTAGMPGSTMFPPNPGESTDAYMSRLHDAGFDNDSIARTMPGFEQYRGGGFTGQWDGWGTGPVMRGPNGYQFANQLQGDPNVIAGTGGYPASHVGGPGAAAGIGGSDDMVGRLLSPFFR